MKQHAQILALFVIFLAVAAPMAAAGTLDPPADPAPTMMRLDQVQPRIPISSLPFTISSPGSYFLTQSLTCAETGITVSTDNVTIDLMGHTLSYNGSGAHKGIYVEWYRNVLIKNGAIEKFAFGVQAVSSSSNVQVANVRLHTLASTGLYLLGSGHVVTDCTVINATNTGIYIHSQGSVFNSIVKESNKGIECGDNSYIMNCRVFNSANDGIKVGENSKVTNCIVKNNTGYGILAGNLSSVANNTSSYNGKAGILLMDSCSAVGNISSYNQTYGIYSNGSSTISGNTITENEYAGIWAGWGDHVFENSLSRNNKVQATNRGGISINQGCIIKNNKLYDTYANGMLVTSQNNTIVGNSICSNNATYGINFNSSGNFFQDNRVSRAPTAFRNPGLQTDGGGNTAF